MQNIEKCVNILKRKGADALVLLDEANMHYLCGFSPSEGIVIVLKNGDAFHLVDSRYTETAENHAKETGLKVPAHCATDSALNSVLNLIRRKNLQKS